MSRRSLTSLCVCLPALMLLQSCSLMSRVPGMDRLAGEEGMFRDRKGEYLEATTIERTRIPDGLDSFVIDDLLYIPDVPGSADQALLDAPRPRPLEGSSDREVVIQRMDERSWIVVDVSPSQVWPRIRDYWRSRQIEIAAENPTAGVMETAWFVREGNVLTRDRVRVMVETGFQDDSSEITLLQMSQPQATPAFDQAPWPASSQEGEVENALVADLSSYLADVADLYTASSVSLLAGSISGTGKAALETGSNGMLLRLMAPYERSWAAVGRALLRADVPVDDQNVTSGVYEVTYVPGSEDDDELEEPGFFKRVFTLNGLFSSNENREPVPLKVQLQRSANGIEVRVEPTAGGPQSQDAAERLLQLIRNTIA
ncbi:MAG TPA: outer membrane protein assembly factor BamC [Hyphomicrobiales bacterium]|nr:outer membrane protein assembly factor BamC [Hyphomicrobiales bacterium]